MKKFNILLSAFACAPNKGSESEVGWQWATKLANKNNLVYVITRNRNKNDIYKFLKKKKLCNLKFIFFDYPDFFLRNFCNNHLGYYIYVIFWHLSIYFVAKPYIKNIKFDFIHHVTFVSARFPNLLCLYKIPFIFGPLAGGEKVPLILRKQFRLKTKLFEFLRDLGNLYLKFSPLMNLTYFKSKYIIVNSENTKNLIPKIYHKKIKKILAIGLENSTTYSAKKKKLFTITYAGNLIDIKGPTIVLQVYKKLLESNLKISLNIVGNGYLRKSLINYSIKNKIYNKINFIKQKDQKSFFKILNNSNLIIAPYLRDSGGMIILESLIREIPIITFDQGGPGQIINKKNGIKIKIDNKNQKQLIKEIYNKTIQIIKNKKLKLKIIQNTKIGLHKFFWDNKISSIYK